MCKYGGFLNEKEKLRFAISEKAKIHVRKTRRKTSSIGAWEHNGETVTIKALCPFTYAYELKELNDLWENGLLEKIKD